MAGVPSAVLARFRPVIKIRYADLPAGLHVQVAVSDRHIIICLLPGLTPVQRHAALQRARSSARLGHGPPVPVAGLAGAIAIDRLRGMARTSVSAARAHPVLFASPAIVVAAAAFAMLLLASVFLHARDRNAALVPRPHMTPRSVQQRRPEQRRPGLRWPVHRRPARQRHAAGSRAGSAGRSQPGLSQLPPRRSRPPAGAPGGRAPSPAPVHAPAPRAAPGRSREPARQPSQRPEPPPGRTPGRTPSPTPLPSPGRTPSPSPSPSPGRTLSPSPSPS